MVIRNYFVLLNIIFPILFFGQNNDFFENEPLNLDFAISSTSETAPVNPFTDYKIQVDFSIGNRRLSVPGFYAADGNAAETSASSGGVWRVMFTPDQVGEWTYHVYFKKGKNLSISEDKYSGVPNEADFNIIIAAISILKTDNQF